MSKRLVCLCNLVDEGEIKAILKKGASSAKEIQQYTRAGTSCGRCLPQIDELVSKHNQERSRDQQKKLDLEF